MPGLTNQWLVVAAVGLLAGCVGAAEGPGGSVDGKADGFGDDSPSVDGAYGLIIESQVESRDAEGEVSIRTTLFWGTAVAASDGAELALSIGPCALDLPSFDGRDAVVDPRVLQELSPIELGGLVTSDDGQRSIATDHGALLLGVQLADPIGDEMPSDGDDGRVIDADGDGDPGVTITMGGWDIYVGLRVTFAFVGAVDADGGVVGEVDLEDELEVYGDGIPFFSARRALEEAAAGSETLSEMNRFALVPLQAEDPPSCEDVSSISFSF